MDSFSYGVVLWEIATKEHSQRGNWRPVRVPQECPAEVEALIRVRQPSAARSSLESSHIHRRLICTNGTVLQAFPVGMAPTAHLTVL